MPYSAGIYPDGAATKIDGSVLPAPFFGRAGNLRSRVYGTPPNDAASQNRDEFYPAIYDTWSLHYEFNKRKMPLGSGGSVIAVGDEDDDGTFDEGGDGNAGKAPVTLIGRVPCKASAENGPIRPGDLLVVDGAVGVEVGLGVVGREPAEELQRVRPEAGELGDVSHRRTPSR